MPAYESYFPASARQQYTAMLRGLPLVGVPSGPTYVPPAQQEWGEPFVNVESTRARLQAIGLDPDSPEGRLYARLNRMPVGRQPSTGLAGDIAAFGQGIVRSVLQTGAGILDLPLAVGRKAGTIPYWWRVEPPGPFQHEVANPWASGAGQLLGTIGQFMAAEGLLAKGLSKVGALLPEMEKLGKVGRVLSSMPVRRLGAMARSSAVFGTYEFLQPGDIEDRLRNLHHGMKTGLFLAGLSPIEGLPAAVRVPWSMASSYVAFEGQPVIDAPLPAWMQHVIFGGISEGIGLWNDYRNRKIVRMALEEAEKRAKAEQERIEGLKGAPGPHETVKRGEKMRAEEQSRLDLNSRYRRLLDILSNPATSEFLSPAQIEMLRQQIGGTDVANPDPHSVDLVERAVAAAARKAKARDQSKKLPGEVEALVDSVRQSVADLPDVRREDPIATAQAHEDPTMTDGPAIRRGGRIYEELVGEETGRPRFSAFVRTGMRFVLRKLFRTEDLPKFHLGSRSTVSTLPYNIRQLELLLKGIRRYTRKFYRGDVPIGTQADILAGPVFAIFKRGIEDTHQLEISEKFLEMVLEDWDSARKYLEDVASAFRRNRLKYGEERVRGLIRAIEEYRESISHWNLEGPQARWEAKRDLSDIFRRELVDTAHFVTKVEEKLADELRKATAPHQVVDAVVRAIERKSLFHEGTAPLDAWSIYFIEMVNHINRVGPPRTDADAYQLLRALYDLASVVDPERGVLPIDTYRQFRKIADDFARNLAGERFVSPSEALAALGHAFTRILHDNRFTGETFSLDPVFSSPYHRRFPDAHPTPLQGDTSIVDAFVGMATMKERATNVRRLADALTRLVRSGKELPEDVEKLESEVAGWLVTEGKADPRTVASLLQEIRHDRFANDGVVIKYSYGKEKTAVPLPVLLTRLARSWSEIAGTRSRWKRYGKYFFFPEKTIPSAARLMILLEKGATTYLDVRAFVEEYVFGLKEALYRARFEGDTEAVHRLEGLYEDVLTFLRQVEQLDYARDPEIVSFARRLADKMEKMEANMKRAMGDIKRVDAEVVQREGDRPPITREEFRSISEHHARLDDHFEYLRINNVLTDLDVRVLREVFRDVPARLAASLRYEPKGPGASLFLPSGWIFVDGLRHSGIGAEVFLHELGHAYFEYALTPSEQALVRAVKDEIQQANGVAWFEGFTASRTGPHYMSSAHEFFAQSFAEYMLGRALGKQVAENSPHLKAIFEGMRSELLPALARLNRRGFIRPLLPLIEVAVKRGEVLEAHPYENFAAPVGRVSFHRRTSHGDVLPSSITIESVVRELENRELALQRKRGSKVAVSGGWHPGGLHASEQADRQLPNEATKKWSYRESMGYSTGLPATKAWSNPVTDRAHRAWVEAHVSGDAETAEAIKVRVSAFRGRDPSLPRPEIPRETRDVVRVPELLEERRRRLEDLCALF